MQLSHYLTPQSIIVPLRGNSKQTVLAELVEILAERHGLGNPKGFIHAIEERERCASTFLPMGVAVPHARIPAIKEIVMIIGVSPTGINDVSGETPLVANVFCLFFSPTEEKEFGKHLKLLARIAAIFSDPGLVGEIAAMTTPEKIFARLQKRERQIDKE